MKIGRGQLSNRLWGGKLSNLNLSRFPRSCRLTKNQVERSSMAISRQLERRPVKTQTPKHECINDRVISPSISRALSRPFREEKALEIGRRRVASSAIQTWLRHSASCRFFSAGRQAGRARIGYRLAITMVSAGSCLSRKKGNSCRFRV